MKEQFELQLPDLLYFVKASCHENLQDTLKVLRSKTSEVKNLYNSHPDFPEKLPVFVLKFIKNLQRHLAHEENTLFPLIATGERRSQSNFIPHLVNDHDQMKEDLLALRRMTHNYQTPEALDNELLDFYVHLKEMDRIILNHIQIEDHVLFPMLLTLES